MARPDAFAHEPLVRRVQIGENQTDGHGFDAGPHEAVQDLVERLAVHGRLDGAVGTDTFPERAAQGPGDQRFDGRHPEIVPVLFQSFPQRQQVPESFGGDQADAGALSFQERVGGDRGAVDEEPGPGQQRGRGHAVRPGDVP